MKKSILVLLIGFLGLSAYAQRDTTYVNPDSLKIKQTRHPQSPVPKYQKFALSGYVKLKGTFDFGPNIQNTSEFITASIPIGADAIQEKSRLSFDARETRVAFDGNFKIEDQMIHTYIEADFYSSEELSNKLFNLRLAYLDIWKLHIGRDWSTFVNLDATPLQVDFEGPNSLPGPKNEMIRFVQNLSNTTVLDIALEMHSSDYTVILEEDPEYQTVPDLVSKITFNKKWGQLSIAGLIRDIAYLNNLYETKHLFGGGANIAGTVNLYPSAKGLQKDGLLFMAVAGKGISYYLDDLSGSGLDAVSLTDNSLSTLAAGGGYLAFQHYWSDTMSSTAMGSYLMLEKDNRIDPTNFKSTVYISGNLMATPIKNLTVGVEYLYGKLALQNSESGDASRIQSMVMYSF